MSAETHKEPLPRAVRRHLGNGWRILRAHGVRGLFGAAMLEAVKLLDPKPGPFLAPGMIWRQSPRMLAEIGLRRTLAALCRYLGVNFAPSPQPTLAPPSEDSPYAHLYDLVYVDGVVPSRRPVNQRDFALSVPFDSFEPPAVARVATIIHAFYPDVLVFLLEKLENIPGTVDLYVSTDTEEKREQIGVILAGWTKGTTEIRVTPNRGRDIAAKFLGFADVYERYDVFLHLHTKKSPHGGVALSTWLDHLVNGLIGSREIAASNLSLFNNSRVGVVFVQHLFEIRGVLNWGYDYDLARGLARRMGVEINKNLPLEFPSGSMFWGRSAAFEPLRRLGLRFEDFPEERGQVDGTLAHSIERLLLICAEAARFEWLKVVHPENYPIAATLLTIGMPEDLPAARIKVFQPVLTPVDVAVHAFSQHYSEAQPFVSYPSRNTRPRLNLLIPTVNPEQTFGGVATALKLFNEWANALGGDFDRRIVATLAPITSAGARSLPDYDKLPCEASLDLAARQLVDAHDRQLGRLDLRAGDAFVATAWWTACQAEDLGQAQRRYFGALAPLIYLVQDDEPYFYGWGSKYALARSTYDPGVADLLIINSEELYETFVSKPGTPRAFCLPYAMNAGVESALRPGLPRERLLLVYGRPSVERNAFGLVCDALCLWQQRDPIRASRWRILFLGQSYDPAHHYPVQNAEVMGKVSLEDYGLLLSRASVGVSLMLSPHPSYPPLEMARAGVATVANAYGVKDLSRRFANIANIERLTAGALAKRIEAAVAEREPTIGQTVEFRTMTPQRNPAPFRATDIAAFIRTFESK